jgi:hypothetical protein
VLDLQSCSSWCNTAALQSLLVSLILLQLLLRAVTLQQTLLLVLMHTRAHITGKPKAMTAGSYQQPLVQASSRSCCCVPHTYCVVERCTVRVGSLINELYNTPSTLCLLYMCCTTAEPLQVHELSHRTSELLQQLDSRHAAHADTLHRLSAAATASVTRHCHSLCSPKRCAPCTNDSSSSSGSDTGKSDSSDEAAPEHRAATSSGVATAAAAAVGHSARANCGVSSGSGARSMLHTATGAVVSPESSPRVSRS